MERLNVSIAEATTALGIGRTTVYKLIKSGDLKTVRILGRHLVPVESIRAIQSEAA